MNASENATTENATTNAEAVLAGITQQGYLLDLTISRWSGQARLTEADLGLEGLTDVELHRLGRRQLVPAEEISAVGKLEQRARKAVEHRSYTFPLGGARFVPIKVLGGLLADLDEARSLFLAAVNSFCERYNQMREQMAAEWMENARRIQSELKKDDAWLADFESRLASAYPTVEKVREAFSMEWSLYQIALPRGVQAKVIAAGEALEAAELAAKARAKVEQQVTAFVGEAAVELRRRTGELCRHVAEQVRKSGEKVSEKSLQPLRDLISQFRALDFTGDSGFAQELERLQTEWLGANKGDKIAEGLRQSEDYRQAMSGALSVMADRAVGDAEKAAAEALERFTRFGRLGRAVVVEDQEQARVE